MKNLIISSAYSYAPEDISIFLKSAHVNAPQAILLLIVAPQQLQWLERYQSYNPNVILKTINDEDLRSFFWKTKYRRIIGRAYLHFYLKHAAKFGWIHKQKHITSVCHISVARYFFALQFLLTHGKDYSDVVLCDSRDVIFSDNPFPEEEHSLISGLEDKRISECDLNKRWITKLFGKNYLKPMLNKLIVCSGITYGKKARVIEYLEQTCQLMQKHLGRTAFRFGLDQASHNVIIRCGMNAHFHLSSNGEPYIATLGYSDLNNFDFDPKMGLLTKEGHPVKILHQYDRHPQLSDWALKRYSS